LKIFVRQYRVERLGFGGGSWVRGGRRGQKL
jgi:hypothetical protein